MNKTEVISKYELMVIVDARLTDEEKESVFAEAKTVVEKSGAKVINSQLWLEKHKLTFDIKKCQDGTYYLFNVEGGGSVVDKMRKDLRLNERILRSAITKV